MKRSQDITDYGKELFDLAQSLTRIHVMAYPAVPQLRRVTVTDDTAAGAETCVDCGCEVTAGDLCCESCDEVRRLTEQVLSRGEE